MEELKNYILEIFNNKKGFIKEKDLKKLLKINGEEQTKIFNNAIKELIEEGSIFFDEKKGYVLFTNDLGIAYGTIEISKNGKGFVTTKDNYKIYIDSLYLNGALTGDKVIINNITKGLGNEYKGNVFKIVKRNNGKAIFTVIKYDNSVTLIPYNNQYNVNINLNKNDLNKLVDGDIIEVIIDKDEFESTYNAYLNNIIGHISDPDLDLKVLANEFDIELNFSDEALKEANELPTEVTLEDMKDRIDLTHLDFVTIDCDNTKDRDDAIYVEKLENGNYKLYTSISSVNHYIKRGSKLFEEIKERCTSHYPNNTCIPMLPHIISNGICSLNPGELRLTKTCEMEIDTSGKVIDYNIYNSVIKSRKAMKYSEVNKVLAGEYVEEYNKYKDLLINMQELNNILSKASTERKNLVFDIPEVEVEKVDGINKFKVNERLDAERLIENFMIITNTTIASHYSWLPFVFRTHDAPNPALIKEVIRKINCAGCRIPETNNISQGTLNNILNHLNKKEEYKVFNELLLRAMEKAKYSTSNNGHYALKLKDYCHFTSPIRRISDFMIHTIIDEAEEHNYDKEYINLLECELNEICKCATKEEINDIKFENEAKKMAMAEYMQDHLNETYSARILEVYQNGMFIRTNELIEGKIKLDDIISKKHKFRYDADTDSIVSKTTKERFRIGEQIEVEATEASKENRTINFKLIKKL